MSAFAHVREVNPFEVSFAPDRVGLSNPPGAGRAEGPSGWGIPLRRGALEDQDKRMAQGGYVESPQPAFSIGNWINDTEEQLPTRFSPPPIAGMGDMHSDDYLLHQFGLEPSQPPPPPIPVPLIPKETSSRGSSQSGQSHHYHASTQASSSASLKPVPGSHSQINSLSQPASQDSRSQSRGSSSQSPPQTMPLVPFHIQPRPIPLASVYVPTRPPQDPIVVPPIKKRGRPPKRPAPKLEDDPNEIFAGEEGLSALERNRLAAQRSRVRKKQMIRNLETDAHEWSRMNDALRHQVSDLESQVVAMRNEVIARHGVGCGCVQSIAYQAYAVQMMNPPPYPGQA